MISDMRHPLSQRDIERIARSWLPLATERIDTAAPVTGDAVCAFILSRLEAPDISLSLPDILFSHRAGYQLLHLVLSMSTPRASTAVQFLVILQRALRRLTAGSATAPRSHLNCRTVRGVDIIFREHGASWLVTAVRRRPPRRRRRVDRSSGVDGTQGVDRSQG